MRKKSAPPDLRHNLAPASSRFDGGAAGSNGAGSTSRGKDLSAFISDEMRQDWEANRDELLEFWRSGKYSVDFFADGVPHLFYRGDRRSLPWAAKHSAFRLSDELVKLSSSLSQTSKLPTWL